MDVLWLEPVRSMLSSLCEAQLVCSGWNIIVKAQHTSLSLPFIWTAEFLSFLRSVMCALLLCPSPIWKYCQSYMEQPLNWAFAIESDILWYSPEAWGDKGRKASWTLFWRIYKCGLLTLQGGGKSIYPLWKFYQSWASQLGGRLNEGSLSLNTSYQ